MTKSPDLLGRGAKATLRLAPAITRLGLIAGIIVSAFALPGILAIGKGVKAGSDLFLSMDAELKTVPAGQTSVVYANDGATPITMFYEEYRKPISINDMSIDVVNAVIAAEDA